MCISYLYYLSYSEDMFQIFFELCVLFISNLQLYKKKVIRVNDFLAPQPGERALYFKKTWRNACFFD